MEWINIHRSVVDSAEFVGSDPVDRATWLCLLSYCCGQENGGRIAGCKDWGDRKWQQVVRVTLKEVRRDCPLFRWEGDDLLVAFYPADKESEVRAKREAGRLTALMRWGKQRQQQPSSDGSSADSSAISSDEQKLDAEGKGREGNGKEVIQGAAPAAPGLPELPLLPPFPDVLNNAAFIPVWDEWLAYRRERKLPAYKPRALAAQLSTLAEWGLDAAVASIRESIRQQWQGLFPPKSGPGAAPRSGAVPWQRKTAQIDHGAGF